MGDNNNNLWLNDLKVPVANTTNGAPTNRALTNVPPTNIPPPINNNNNADERIPHIPDEGHVNDVRLNPEPNPNHLDHPLPQVPDEGHVNEVRSNDLEDDVDRVNPGRPWGGERKAIVPDGSPEARGF
ncbi:hypothetical protein CPB86DRAFT_387426 [Serendipita vermifera]|nr:hypothetical protein CPB86DRAFT_387426 [Serendipita vermifera]